jgi:hypothetical protein
MKAARLLGRSRPPTFHAPTAAALEEARSLLRDAVASQPGPFDWYEVADRVRARSASLDLALLEGLLIAGTVNDTRRRHFPDPMDLAFRRDDGLLERYDPAFHGRWSDVGTLRLVPTGVVTVPAGSLGEAPGF